MTPKMNPKNIEKALTFEDILICPNYSNILPKDTNLTSAFTQNIKLNIPIVSAAMDTVTEKNMAIALAQQGGIGVIHKNMSIDKQQTQVKAVKRFASHIVDNPITVDISDSINNVLALKAAHQISSIPVIQNNQLVGIITARDLRIAKTDSTIGQIMTPQNKLITVQKNTPREQIINLMHQHRIEQIMITNDAKQLIGIVALKDVEREKIYPDACVDLKGQLRVAGAVGVSAHEKQRIKALVEAGVDAIVIDTAHGHSQGVIDQLKWCKQQSLNIDIIAGNIATHQAAIDLINAGADAVKVGIGPGSICTTRIISGVGMPQVSAIQAVASVCCEKNIPLIADGGICYSGDISKALACGASSVMLGSLLAGTEESPGDIQYYQGRAYKGYRGMGSLEAMGQLYGSSDRYFQDHQNNQKLVPEGVEGRVFFKGPLHQIIHQLTGGIRACMGYTGCQTLTDLYEKSTIVQISVSSTKESHVHDVIITKEAPNYHTQ